MILIIFTIEANEEREATGAPARLTAKEERKKGWKKERREKKLSETDEDNR